MKNNEKVVKKDISKNMVSISLKKHLDKAFSALLKKKLLETTDNGENERKLAEELNPRKKKLKPIKKPFVIPIQSYYCFSVGFKEESS